MKRLLGILLTVVMLVSLPAAALGANEAIIPQNQAVDILITADNTYTGDKAAFAANLASALQSAGLNTGDYRITSKQTTVSLSNFDNWYVYDHYYNPTYNTNGTAPDNWNNYSGRHPYDYYKEIHVDGLPSSVEAALHTAVWSRYVLWMDTCGATDLAFYSYYETKYPYAALDVTAKSAAYAGVEASVYQIVARQFYDTSYESLTNEQKSDPDFTGSIDNRLTNDFTYYYGKWGYESLSSAAKKTLTDAYVLETNVKSSYTAEQWAGLSDTDKAAALASYKDTWGNSTFGAGFSTADDTTKTQTVSNYYYSSFFPASTELTNYKNTHPNYMYTESPPNERDFSTIYYRNKHVYTNIDANNNASMTFLGYSAPAYKDFLIYPTANDNAKTIAFDIDASQVHTHTLDGAGFLINSGIDGSGYIKGYLVFYQFTNDTTKSGTVYLMKIKDGVSAAALHNNASSAITTYVDVIASQAFSFNTTSNKKHISVTFTPTSLVCTDADYAADKTTLGTANNLFGGSAALTSTGFNGYGPITSYKSHSCPMLSAFTFSNLKMGYENSSVEGLRNATYIAGAKKIYIVLTGIPETDLHSDLNAYYGLLTRLTQDQVFYITTGGGYTIAASGGNGLDISNSVSADTVATYIANIKSGSTAWNATTLPSGSNLLPVAVFDITGSDGTSQIVAIDRKMLTPDGMIITFGNTSKSAALTTGASIQSCSYIVTDPNGNPITPLTGANGNELTVNNTSALGDYSFKMTVSDGTRTSTTATRTLTVTDSSTFTVTFDAQGGSDVAAMTNVPYGLKIDAPTAPTKDASAFVGWYKDAGLTTAWNFTTDTVTADTTLYAKWTYSGPCTVTFDSQGGSAVAGLTGVNSGSTISAPTPDPTKAGNTFGGWYKEAELTNAWNFATDTLTAASIYLYAKWIPDNNTYTVTFDSGDGSAVTGLTGVATGSTIAEPSQPTKSGSTFGGWYKDNGFLNPWDFIVDAVTADTTLYAKWIEEVVSYTVTFNSEGGTAVSPLTSVAAGSFISAPSPEPTKSDCTFSGWYKDNDFVTAWDFAADTVNVSTTLYAKWSPTPGTPAMSYIAAGANHTLVLVNGAVFAFGDNSAGQCDVPALCSTGVVGVLAGGNRSAAIKEDGSIVTWGK